MSNIELYELFLGLCKEYIDTYEAAVLTEGENQFQLYKPREENKVALYYKIMIRNLTEQGSSTTIESLLENAIYAVGTGKFDMAKIHELDIELDLDIEEEPESRGRFF